MNMGRKVVGSGLSFFVVVGLVGCASNEMTRSGFIDDYKRLAPTQYENVLMYRAPGFEPRNYADIVVRDAVIKAKSGQIQGIDKSQEREILAYITSELRRQVAKPGATAGLSLGRLQVRAALTELETPNRAVNWMTTLAVGPVTSGGASMELEVVDERTGRPVMAASCFDRGNVVTDFLSSYSQLGHAKVAVTNCIEQIDSVWRGTPLK
ncbi:DUF3313 family protein [Pseudomonas tolaasii]|uniref:DUF3313 family protein n=1 Tax=Pseudomonas tolaasii TaxID=29442 RepID=UPI0004CEB24A|nr:DUF3313 family protein [Pseudomonas tolaasii]